MSERFYEDEIAFEAFGHEGLILGRLYAPPGNGFAVIEGLFLTETELEAIGSGGMK